ncbi:MULTISPECIES: hypothetical protein [unclassified Streptomyces]|uniref:hypothetical protein n=1 Tax=unclassified Streptomyces TaxID=2593676 RepID=UPI00093B82E3|nr:hypothetical protein [Streptomyces sp. CB02400]OKJ99950.1 hypothetical protein AMK33_27880 [Streptomyces sp. CB02400]
MLTVELAEDLSDPSWKPEWRPDYLPVQPRGGFAEMTSDDFTFLCFKVRLFLRTERERVRLRVVELPAVDFALMLRFLQRQVAEEGSGTAEASLNDFAVHARETGDGIVTLSFARHEGEYEMTRDELSELVRGVGRAALGLMCEAHPELRANPYLRSLGL